MNDIFNDCYEKALLNVNILFPYTNDSMMMTTYIPFEFDCIKLERRNLGILSEKKFNMSESFAEVFPMKGLNMNRCTLIVATFPSEPLVIVQMVNDTTNDIVTEGVEVELLQQMAKALNFTVRFKLPADKQKRGIIDRNGTSTGCFKMVNLCRFTVIFIIFPSSDRLFHQHVLVDDGRSKSHYRNLCV